MSVLRKRPTTVALWQLNERERSVWPVDELANVELSPTGGPGNTLPVIAELGDGAARTLGTSATMDGSELVADSTRITRSVTIRALVHFEGATGGPTGSLIQRGIGGSAAERILWGMEIAFSGSTRTLRARWQEQNGTEADTLGASYSAKAGRRYLAIVRSWLQDDTVDVFYYVDGKLIGSENAERGDIGEGSGGTIVLGYDGATTYIANNTLIEALAVDADAASLEELRWEAREILEYQPDGYRTLRAYIPPGSTWPRNPTSRVQRWIAAEGAAIGLAVAEAERLREALIPDRAWGEALEAWERITGAAKRALDTVTDRRARVASFLAGQAGFQIQELIESLTGVGVFNMPATLVQIWEFDGERRDNFGTDDITTPPSSLWTTHDGGSSSGTVWTVNTGTNDCAVSTQAADNLDPPAVPRRVADLTHNLGDSFVGATMVCQVNGSLASADFAIGHVWQGPEGMVFVGVRYDSGSSMQELVAFEWTVDGGLSAVTVIAEISASTTTSAYVRSSIVSTTGDGKARFGAGHGTVFAGPYTGDFGVGSGFSAGFSVGFGGPAGFESSITPHRVGFGVVGLDGAVSLALSNTVKDVAIFEPRGARGGSWLAYRDPVEPGAYSVGQAQLQINGQGPASAQGWALDDLRGFLLGESPLGGAPLLPHLNPGQTARTG